MSKIAELKRLQFNREYFEKGCKCIHVGTLRKLKPEIDNQFAVSYYEKFCECLRNYAKCEKPCQDPEALRCTGRSSTVIQKLPKRAFYVYGMYGSKHFYQQMRHDLGRNDVTLISLRDFFTRHCWQGRDVYIDHYVFENCNGPERDRLLSYIARGEVKGIYEELT